jgi:hypothetical protein
LVSSNRRHLFVTPWDTSLFELFKNKATRLLVVFAVLWCRWCCWFHLLSIASLLLLECLLLIKSLLFLASFLFETTLLALFCSCNRRLCYCYCCLFKCHLLASRLWLASLHYKDGVHVVAGFPAVAGIPEMVDVPMQVSLLLLCMYVRDENV